MVVKQASIEDNPDDDTVQTSLPKSYMRAYDLVKLDSFVCTHGPSTKVDDTATSWNLGSEDIYKTFFTAAATNPSLWEGPTSTGESRLPVTMPSSAARPYPLTPM
nr:uncharacterized protein LOC128695344 [Cherax quadricarinatus]